MLKKTITYEDFEGNSQTEDFYFHLSKAELIELELSEKEGFGEMLKKIVAETDGQRIIENFKKIILMSYGQKSDDGKRFIKTQELRDAFSQTEAYSQLFMDLATNAGEAAAFMRGVIPASLEKELSPELDTVAETPKMIKKPK